MSLYLDYTATTPVLQEVLQLYTRDLEQYYANPASLHGLGLAADKSLAASRNKVKKLLGGEKSRLILTSGGSESINTALKGFFQANKRLPRKLIISQGEHPAVRQSAAFLKSTGIDIEAVSLNRRGTVDLQALEKSLQEPAAMLSLIHVNNETGAVNPLEEIVALRNRFCPQMVIHIDAVQSPGKAYFAFERLGIDLASGSGHKFGAPKGIGWLLLRRELRLEPLIHGGGQQNNLRSGTENPPLAAALAKALELAVGNLTQKAEIVRCLKQQYLSRLDESGVKYVVVSPDDGVAPILAISFPGIQAETMLHALEGKQVYVSAGSACSSRRKTSNYVLKAMQIKPEVAASTVRISFAPHLSLEDINRAAGATAECYKYLIRI